MLLRRLPLAIALSLVAVGPALALDEVGRVGTAPVAVRVVGEPGETAPAGPVPAEVAPAESVAGLPGLAAAVGAEPALADFYAARGHASIWAETAGDVAPPRAEALLAAVRRAPSHALPAARYRPDALADALARPWDARAEALFSAVFLDLARDLASGLLEPRRIDKRMDVDPIRPEPQALLGGVATARDAGAYLDALAPAMPEYERLRQRLAALAHLATEPGAWGPRLGKGRTLREGDRGADVARLRRRLDAMGLVVPVAAPVPDDVVVAENVPGLGAAAEAGVGDLFDAGLAEAVRRFQALHGLNTDGVVGPATRAALDVEPVTRARQVAVNLERIRWNHARLTGRRLEVNLPDYHVRKIEGGAVVFESRVVIGKYKHQTVEFSDTMDHMVVNPTWYVPRSIATREILPRLKQDPGYLAARNMRLVGADPWSVDWASVTPASFPGRVQQAPGRGNALGQVKFMFPNHHAIYLHDTPQRRLFGRDVRAYSHGCVRVEKPAELAAHLLAGQEVAPEEAFSTWVARRRERRVDLVEPMPVHLLYRTAWVDADGTAQFRGDVYGRDAKVAAALERAGVTLPEG